MSGEPAWTAASINFVFSPVQSGKNLAIKQDSMKLYMVQFCCSMWRVPLFNAMRGGWHCPECTIPIVDQPGGYGISNQLDLAYGKTEPVHQMRELILWVSQWMGVEINDVHATITY